MLSEMTNFLCRFGLAAHPNGRRRWCHSRRKKGLTMARGSEENPSGDNSVLTHIDHLVKEEVRLYGQDHLDDVDTKRLGELKVELDQCWDLLRQRRALREFGNDPDKAKVRPAK